ncbi:MAG: hypothetical protein OK439_02790 [Thaumarchaeota archaeon]|nr:hypothetical protein [Nitrososphaerota archaeon]
MEDDYVEEACFYLSEIKSTEEISKEFSLTPSQVKSAIDSYQKKIDTKQISYDVETKQFWAQINQESTGDEKITLVDDKGRYYHGWKTEIEKLDTAALVELLVINKKYSDRHPLSEFSKTQPVVGYDPIIPLRNIRKTVLLIDKILQSRENEIDPTTG